MVHFERNFHLHISSVVQQAVLVSSSICAACDMKLSASFSGPPSDLARFSTFPPFRDRLYQVFSSNPLSEQALRHCSVCMALADVLDSIVEVQGTSRKTTSSCDRRYGFGLTVFLFQWNRQVSCQDHGYLLVDRHCIPRWSPLHLWSSLVTAGKRLCDLASAFSRGRTNLYLDWPGHARKRMPS